MPTISGNENQSADPYRMTLVIRDGEFTYTELRQTALSGFPEFLQVVREKQPDAYIEWTSGRFTKLLKHAKSSLFAKISKEALSSVSSPNCQLVFLPLRRLSEETPNERRAQIAYLHVRPGRELPQGYTAGNGLRILINPDLTPGKGTVAALHVAQVAQLEGNDIFEPFSELGEISEMSDEHDIVIHDAGQTEVIPGTITAVGDYV